MKNKIIFGILTICIVAFIIIYALSQNSNTANSLDSIVSQNDKINIYFFWGEGCPHCKKEFEFFDSIKEDYQDMYNLYTFEVLNNKENANILKKFAKIMDKKVTGVPFTIIGNQTFSGFKEELQESMLDAIKNESPSGFDVYKEYLKNE